MDVESEYAESSSLTFEWTLRGLKHLFDSTRGDKKSKVTKSIRFGGNRWQILFYANAGQTTKEGAENGFVSLYLSCEPTVEEKETALADNGRWVREGVYKFSFELRNVGKSITYSSKEAKDHSFTWKTANWGWAQFAKRDNVFYQSLPVKAHDAFVIICQITSSPAPPPVQTLPKQPVPKSLIDTVGMLLDDPRYADVEFILPSRSGDTKETRRIFASKRLLERADYFHTMFQSSFAEGTNHDGDVPAPALVVEDEAEVQPTHPSFLLDGFEDSDDEEDEDHITTREGFADIESAHRVDDVSMTVTESNPTESDSLDDTTLHPEGPSTQVLEAVSTSDTQARSSSLPSKRKVVIRDIAYTTFKAMLYYIYTDTVVFAPLLSSFIAPKVDVSAMPVDSITSPLADSPTQGTIARRFSTSSGSLSRTDWIREWMKANLGRPAPCSAKSMYRVADRFELWDLKDRASAHIIKSLTVENIAYEVFSPFAAAFEQIRKAEVEYFLGHWQEIRTSDAMKNVWVQIRNGRHPGFEEVWPQIAQSLEFKPSTPSLASPRSEEMG